MARRHSLDIKAFGHAVRTARIHSELTQERLAELSGLHRTYIGGIERGERNLSLKNILALAAALKCAPSELLRAAEVSSVEMRRR